MMKMNMMKRILWTLLLVAVAMPVAAQRPRTRVEWGVVGGINVPDFSTDMDKAEIRDKCG